jgi:hypothetical protein
LCAAPHWLISLLAHWRRRSGVKCQRRHSPRYCGRVRQADTQLVKIGQNKDSVPRMPR